MTKNRAVAVIADKFWITYDGAAKNGTLRLDAEQVYTHILSDSNLPTVTYTADQIESMFEFEEKTESTWHQQHVFGYPVIKTDVFKEQEKDNLPCFTKTIKSNVYHAAGYYAIFFPNAGWIESFCPKLKQLEYYKQLKEQMGLLKPQFLMENVLQK